MPTCERCWTDAHRDPYADSVAEYRRLCESRTCTPEQQAGPDATTCFRCARRTGHQHCGVCMACGHDPTVCRQCGGKVERVRWCYATPVCFACLPPPPPIPVAPECTCDPADGFGLIGGGWDPSCEMHGKHAQGSR